MCWIEWLWSIATGSMPDTTGKPQGLARPCLWSHSSPANASSAFPLRFGRAAKLASVLFACVSCSCFLFLFFLLAVCCVVKASSWRKNKKTEKWTIVTKNGKNENRTATFDGFLSLLREIDFVFKNNKSWAYRGGKGLSREVIRDSAAHQASSRRDLSLWACCLPLSPSSSDHNLTRSLLRNSKPAQRTGSLEISRHNQRRNTR